MLAAWGAFVWHQTGKTVLLEGRLCPIERWPGKAEVRGSIRHRLAFGPYPAQHLVLDLHQIASIEEIVLEKQLASRTAFGRGFSVPCC
jgi:hypothetical protein